MLKQTQEEYLSKCKNIHGDYYDYSKVSYTGIKNKVKIICPKHGEFSQSAEKHINGRGCRKCGVLKQKNTCLKKFGTENPFSSNQIKDKIKSTMMEKYGGVGMSSPEIKLKIKNTNVERYGKENVFSCKEIIKKSTRNKDYKSSSAKAKFTNLKKYGVECVLSLDEIRNKSTSNVHDKMVKEIFEGNRLKNKCIPKFKPEDYDGVTNNYQFECVDCGNIFSGNLDDGKIPTCTHCFPYIVNSKIEYDIKKYIEENKPSYTVELSNRSILSGKELDIYVPEIKTAIEFNGIYYHSEIHGNKNKTYHQQKSNLCQKLGIRLIHVFEDEWVEKIDIVKSRIASVLRLKNLKTIFARNCKISIIPTSLCNKFLNENHIQGDDRSSIRLGLYYEDELVSVMTFGSLRRSLGYTKNVKGSFEMYRFCVKKYHHVPGAANKLISFFIKNYQPKSIVTYADRRWSDGNLYKTINFKYIGTTSPNYWYIDKSHKKRYHRFNFRKNILNKKIENFDPSLTEWQNMQLNGYDRIWDCGHLKFLWESPDIN